MEQAHWTRVADGRHELDLLTARFHQHAYARHSHDTFAIGVVLSGSERFTYRGGGHHAGVGSVAILEPGEPHDGQAAEPGGWAYRVLYPTEALLMEGRATRPHFRDAVLDDPLVGQLVRAAHEELTSGADRLAGHSRLVWALECLIARHGGRAGAPPRPPRVADPAADRVVRLVRDRLSADLAIQPSLRDLAASVDLSPYHMLRVFRAATGFPPHAWLVLERICRARHLLAAGCTPASISAEVGFADQAHMTRWFKRVVGVTPAAYRNSVQDPRRLRP